MILVLADDLSGAAEVAGVAVRRGYTAEVRVFWDDGAWEGEAPAEPLAARGFSSAGASPSRSEPSQIIAISTGGRGVTADEAGRRVEAILRQAVAENPPERIFLKCDSVLRGHVLDEIFGALTALGGSAALLLPANPDKGRVIVGGNYFVGGVPLEQTVFASDPDFPRHTADLRQLLGERAMVLRSTVLPVSWRGVLVPDVQSTADLQRLLAAAPRDCLLAGAAECFAALLEPRATQPKLVPCEPTPGERLFVCGSAVAWKQGRAEQFRARGQPVMELLPRLTTLPVSSEQIASWAEETLASLESAGAALLALGQAPGQASASGAELVSLLGAVVAECLRQRPALELLVEGGETAAAVVLALGWKRLLAQTEIAPGVIRLQPTCSAARLIVKVGSYDWPEMLVKR